MEKTNMNEEEIKYKEILDIIGKKLTESIYTESISWIEELTVDQIKNMQGVKNLFLDLSEEKKEELLQMISRISSDQLFGLLCFFEEQPPRPSGRFRLIYEEDGKQYDLTEISENLKAEPIIAGGWFDRFSRYKRPNEIPF